MKKTLEKWQDTILATDLQIEKLRDFFKCVECEFINTIEQLQCEYTYSIAREIGDEYGTLTWYWMENSMGADGFQAGVNGNVNHINNIDDLVRLLESYKEKGI